MFTFFQNSLTVFTLALFFVACNDKDKAPLDIPGAYDGTSFSANIATQDAIRGQLEALVNEAKKGRTSGVLLDYTTLTQLFNAGNPSLKASQPVTTPIVWTARATGSMKWQKPAVPRTLQAFQPAMVVC
ncbi:MAG: hypothetical protein IPH31_02280 [Lewinellaceae bacterium]|nr:hypothetical protein [Lewinellaceae bacterium]